MTKPLTVLPERNLDILRAIAVSCVLADHILTTWSLRLPGNGRWAVGRLGVLLFFVHTSLVLMSSLERQGTGRPGWISAFYIRRAFRIYPLSVITVLFAVLARMPEHVAQPPMEPAVITARTLVANLALVQNVTSDPSILGVFWSLPLEVQMYLLLPFCFLIARARSRDVGTMVTVLVALGLLVGFAPIRGLWRLSVFSFGPCFAGGIVAYHLLRKGVKPRFPAWWWPLAIAASSALFFASQPTVERPETGWLPCLLLGICIPFIGEATRSPLTQFAHKACEVSYGIYLLHVPVLWIAFAVLRDAPLALRWVVFGGLLTALPVLAYRFIERPGVRLGQDLAKKRMPRALEVGAP